MAAHLVIKSAATQQWKITVVKSWLKFTSFQIINLRTDTWIGIVKECAELKVKFIIKFIVKYLANLAKSAE